MVCFNDPMEYKMVKAKLADLHKYQTLRRQFQAIKREKNQNVQIQGKNGAGRFFRLLGEQFLRACLKKRVNP